MDRAEAAHTKELGTGYLWLERVLKGTQARRIEHMAGGNCICADCARRTVDEVPTRYEISVSASGRRQSRCERVAKVASLIRRASVVRLIQVSARAISALLRG